MTSTAHPAASGASYPFDLGTFTRPAATTSPDAQRWFDRGLVWSYGFHHEEAIRCFEAAIYVTAASLCLRELEFIAVVASVGSRIVQCIGIFFGTRVMIGANARRTGLPRSTLKPTTGD